MSKLLEGLGEPDIPFPDEPPAETSSEPWAPKLNPTQQKVFDCTAKYVFAYGEKYSGKTIGCTHALVRHCYEEANALALIIAPAIRSGKEGVLADLAWILDIWRNGNWTDRTQTARADNGIGLSYTEAALDSNTKDRVVFIGNQHGGWSKVILVSMPYEEVVSKRMKAISPSFVYADEFTELGGPAYFTDVAMQVGRRRMVTGRQQYYASMNPEGPSHWAYKIMYEDCVDQKTGKRNPDYAVIHVPIVENIKNQPPGYVEGLYDLFKKDPTKEARLVRGEWIDRPSGDAIFKNDYRPEIHVRPALGTPEQLRGDKLLPIPGLPMIGSYDPGPANYSVHFLQMIPVRNRGPMWIVFDELNFVGEYTPDYVVVPKVMDLMDEWEHFAGVQVSWAHIAPDDAFNTMRQDGSYDATQMLKLSKNRIRFRPCPQPKQSVPSRVSMVKNLFLSDSLFISAKCKKTQDMLRLLTSLKVKDGEYDEFVGLRPKRSPYIHPFDSMTYAPYYFQMNPSAFAINTGPTPGVFRAGER